MREETLGRSKTSSYALDFQISWNPYVDIIPGTESSKISRGKCSYGEGRNDKGYQSVQMTIYSIGRLS